MAFHNLQSHLAYQYIRMCVFIRHILCESLVKLCLTKYKYCSFLQFFSDIWQSFRIVQTQSLETKKSGHVRINLDKIRWMDLMWSRSITSRTYLRPLYKLVQVADTLQNSKISDRKTFLIYIINALEYPKNRQQYRLRYSIIFTSLLFIYRYI